MKIGFGPPQKKILRTPVGAMAIFRIKILPLVTYCLRPIAPELTFTALKHLDAVKPTFLEMVMGIPCNTSNKLRLEMAGETKTLAEELKEKDYSTTSTRKLGQGTKHTERRER